MTANASQMPPAQWQVVAQTPTNDLSVSGAVVPGYSVTFLTGLGNRGSVFVPQSQYTPEAVKSAIRSEAAKLDAISQLTHDS